MAEVIELDGSYGEGGGSLVRVALALSCLTQKPFRVKEIRKGRSQPGLKNQHLYGIKALKELCNAKVKGDFLGSTELEFIPDKISAKNIDINIGTAGSITLVLQSILLPLIFSGKKITLNITGGTDTKWSPQMDYTREVFLSYIKNFAEIEIELIRRGYYPKGNGRISITINSKDKEYNSGKLSKLNLIERGSIVGIEGKSHASSDLKTANVAERQAEAAGKVIRKEYNINPSIDIEYCQSDSPGSGISLWAVFSNGAIIGSDCLGEKGKKSEIVGEEAAKNIIKEIGSGAVVDRNMADQILPYLAIAKGSIKTSEITQHCRTNIYVIEKFQGKVFEVNEVDKIIKIT